MARSSTDLAPPAPAPPGSATRLQGGEAGARLDEAGAGACPPGPLGLERLLRLLPERELMALVSGLRVRVDRSKRIDAPAQLARALLVRPDSRDLSRLPAPCVQLLRRLIEARGVLRVRSLPASTQPLLARGLVFARDVGGGSAELLLPIAYLMQLPTWEGEEPRGLRPLLLQVSAEVAGAIAAHYAGRSPGQSLPLALEGAWLALTDPERLRAELADLATAERRLLEAVEELGGEVDTEELLELEREPLRLRTASGATPSRRGVGFALERRGLLIPVRPDRHVVPAEVSRIVGAPLARQRQARRVAVLERVAQEDAAPRRARYARDVVPLAVALVAFLRERSIEVKPALGTPRSLIARLAARFGREAEEVALVAALSRSSGLWDPSARNVGAPPGSLSLAGLGQQLFALWRRGGGWDEARPEPEVLRAAGPAREASAVGGVRELVLESLSDLAEDRWVSWDALSEFILNDPRARGLQRLLERWGRRVGSPEGSTRLEAVVERVVFSSLHYLGCLDLAASGDTRSLRLTPRARAYLSGQPPAGCAPSQFVDDQTLRLGAQEPVARVLSVAAFAEVGRADDELELTITQPSISRALAQGVEASALQQHLEAVTELPQPLQEQLDRAGAVVGRVELVRAAGFLWVEDPEVRALLRSRRTTSELFLDPSPPGGLLLAPGIEQQRLVLRCRSLGVEVVAEGGTLRLAASPGFEPKPEDAAPGAGSNRSARRAHPAKKSPPRSASRRASRSR